MTHEWWTCPTCLKRLILRDGQVPRHGRRPFGEAFNVCPTSFTQAEPEFVDPRQMRIEGLE